MKVCTDPRHETPCPDPETCPACQEECDPEYWVEIDEEVSDGD